MRFYIYTKLRKHYYRKGSIDAPNAHTALSLWLGSKVKAYRYRKVRKYAVTNFRLPAQSKIVKAKSIEPYITYLYWGW